MKPSASLWTFFVIGVNPMTEDSDLITVVKTKGCIYPKYLFRCPPIPRDITNVLENYGTVIVHDFARPLIKVQSLGHQIITVVGSERIQLFFVTRDVDNTVKDKLLQDLRDFFASKHRTFH